MKTIERNYRKNPHTANFLMTFHSAAHGLPSDAEAPADDLLNLVPETTDARTPAQARLMESLHAQLLELDAETGMKAVDYTVGMTIRGLWTPGRNGNASEWITRMIAKVKELKAAAVKPVSGSPAARVADGRYAVEEGGTLKFFRVKNGRRPGFVFLDIQASDDWHKISNVTRIREVLALIAVDPKAAMIRYGKELGQCGRCGKTLTSEYRDLGLGPVCIDK